MTMECMDRQALAGFVHSFNQSIRAISILLMEGLCFYFFQIPGNKGF